MQNFSNLGKNNEFSNNYTFPISVMKNYVFGEFTTFSTS